MPSIDSLLTLVDRQGANELRLGADRDPQMFADGAPKRLTMPKTSMDTLRELLGELLAGERERVLVEQGQAQFIHEAPGAGNFRVTLVRRGLPGAPLEIDAIFMRARSKATASPPLAPAARPAPLAATPALAPVPVPVPVPVAPAVATDPPLAAATTGAEPAAALLALITRAAALHASDIHLLDGEAPVIRVDGRLGPLASG